MSMEFEVPPEIGNVDQWRTHCRRIRARAEDFLADRLSLVETARELLRLAYWAKVGGDPEFQVFRAIDTETRFLPVGEVRQYWAPEALEREDVQIRATEATWSERARYAAERLVERYQWTLPRNRRLATRRETPRPAAGLDQAPHS